MSTRCCASNTRLLGRRCAALAGWAVPGTTLMLMPKCPLCLAAYVAAGTGLAVSASAASWLRTGTVVLCVAWLLYAGVQFYRQRLLRKENPI